MNSIPWMPLNMSVSRIKNVRVNKIESPRVNVVKIQILAYRNSKNTKNVFLVFLLLKGKNMHIQKWMGEKKIS